MCAALAAGRGACLVEHTGVEAFGFDDARIAATAGLKAASALVAAAYHGNPSEKLDVLAVTGTNGKTSTVWWLAQALSNLLCSAAALRHGGHAGRRPTAGRRPPALGRADGHRPDDAGPVLLQGSLRVSPMPAPRACAIEASSIGIEDHRLDGTASIPPSSPTSRRTTWTTTARCRPTGGQAAPVPAGPACKPRSSTSTTRTAPNCCRAGGARAGPVDRLAQRPGPAAAPARCRTPARHGVQVRRRAAQHRSRPADRSLQRVQPARRAGRACVRSGVPLAEAVSRLPRAAPVPGRMQCVAQPGSRWLVVDYAHTPMRWTGAGRAAPAGRAARRAVVVRVRLRRQPRPGQAPADGCRRGPGADRVVVTSDNPRSEDPLAILQQILPGLAGHGQ
jgi:hypothetical protein